MVVLGGIVVGCAGRTTVPGRIAVLGGGVGPGCTGRTAAPGCVVV
jgi:hypothetical protein